jgi:RNA polymerase sigma-70 factor (ECF subfamily)
LGIAGLVAKVDRRSKRRRRDICADDIVEEAVEPAASAVEVIEEAEARARLLAALGSVKADARRLLTSFLLEGQTCQDIADDLGVPVGTVYSRLHKARKALARAASAQSRREDPKPARRRAPPARSPA